MGFASLSAWWRKDLDVNQEVSHSPHTHWCQCFCMWVFLTEALGVGGWTWISLWTQRRTEGFWSPSLPGWPRMMRVSLGSHSVVSATRKIRGKESCVCKGFWKPSDRWEMPEANDLFLLPYSVMWAASWGRHFPSQVSSGMWTEWAWRSGMKVMQPVSRTTAHL